VVIKRLDAGGIDYLGTAFAARSVKSFYNGRKDFNVRWAAA
jgi:hypothetical protein